MPCLDIEDLGRRTDNFNPDSFPEPKRENFIRFLEKRKVLRNKFKHLIIPRCGFTNEIVLPDSSLQDRFIWSEKLADGAYVTKPEYAIAFFPGDCLIGIAYNQKAGQLAVVHLGYKSLLNESGIREDSILDTLFCQYQFPIKGTAFRLGWGIGSCCYGIEHYPEIPGITYSVACRGPRKGERSISLRGIARKKLRELGLCANQITTHTTCTGCSGRRNGKLGYPHYYSQTWGDLKERNLVAVTYRDKW